MVWDRSFIREIAIAGTVLFCLVVVGVVRATRRPAQDEQTPAAMAGVSTNLDGQTQELFQATDRPVRKAAQQLVLDAIAEHREVIAEDPNHEDVPAYQLAIANLYISKLGDYESASSELEEIVSRVPDSNLSAQAYAKLGKCYENLGWRGVVNNTYKRMMRHFPEGSPNWEYASAKRRGDDNIY